MDCKQKIKRCFTIHRVCKLNRERSEGMYGGVFWSEYLRFRIRNVEALLLIGWAARFCGTLVIGFFKLGYGPKVRL